MVLWSARLPTALTLSFPEVADGPMSMLNAAPSAMVRAWLKVRVPVVPSVAGPIVDAANAVRSPFTVPLPLRVCWVARVAAGFADTSSRAPLMTVMVGETSVPSPFNARVPEWMVVVPVKRLAPARVSVPLPDLANAPEPDRTPE